MALYLKAKAPTSVFRYSWEPDLIDGESLATATLTVSTGAAAIDSYAIEQNTVQFFLSGGTDGETTIITATATTDDGETFAETIYIPINVKTQAFGYTARDICNMALRKITGIGATPTADELDDALERLSDMIAGWAEEGADFGLDVPILANDTMYVPDWAIGAIKANLTAKIADFYGQQLDRSTLMDAQRGLQRIKYNFLPDVRDGVEYF